MGKSKIIALRPGDTKSLNDLGSLLNAQGKHAEAEAIYRKLIALKPHYVLAYTNLGDALYGQGKYAEAESAFRKSIELFPGSAYVHNTLGRVLHDKGDLDGAIACYKKALELDPKNIKAHLNLGHVFAQLGKYAEGEAANRKAIALQPDNAPAYSNLGHFLNVQGKTAEAEVVCRKAIALQPDLALAHCNLGHALQAQGRFAESLAAYRRGHDLGSKQSGWSHTSRQWVRTAERFVELEKKLPAILQGEASPANADEAVTVAHMCHFKKRHLAAARFYADAFAADPKFAGDMNLHYRYYAACSAALAAAGQGEDAGLLPDRVVAMLRHRALGWLRDHLTANAKLAEKKDPAENKMIQQRLDHWRSDPDLASLRDPQMLQRLPNAERAAYKALWRDVDELAVRIVKKAD